MPMVLLEKDEWYVCEWRKVGACPPTPGQVMADVPQAVLDRYAKAVAEFNEAERQLAVFYYRKEG